MPVEALFPSLVYVAPLRRGGTGTLNRRLLRHCDQIRNDDVAGRRWSKRNYPGGYTSYNSAARLHRESDAFAALERAVDRHARRFAWQLGLDLAGRELSMTDCWINVMPPGVAHGLHLHPLSTLSGTYYLRTPRGVPGLKFEDPRLERYMATPPRRADAPRALQPWVVVPARAGTLILFESWLRHEVTTNLARTERVSVSFNYNWF